MQLLIFNEEFLVSACHQRALITSLPFVHTARRSYRLNDPVRPLDCGNAAGSPAAMPREAVQTLSFRGRRSRNKVSVGEPAEGSLPVFPPSTRVRTWAVAPASLSRARRLRLLLACARRCVRLLDARARALRLLCVLGRRAQRGGRGSHRHCSCARARPPVGDARALSSRARPPSVVVCPFLAVRACASCGFGPHARARPRLSQETCEHTHNSCRWISWLSQR